MAEKQAKATSTVKSGIVNRELPGKLLGGNPPEKGVEEIEKQSRPKTAPGSVRG